MKHFLAGFVSGALAATAAYGVPLWIVGRGVYFPHRPTHKAETVGADYLVIEMEPDEVRTVGSDAVDTGLWD